MEYRVKVYGREVVSSAYGITNDEMDVIYDYMDEMGIEDVNTIGDNIEDVIGNDLFNRDIWSVSKPLDYEHKTNFMVENEDSVEILNFDITDIENVDNIYNDSTHLNGIPDDLHGNIMVTIEEKKGFVLEYKITSSTIPKISDFTYTQSFITTPDSEIDFIQEVHYKGLDLTPTDDEKWVRRISYEIELHTLDIL